jgi:hypothetical protein
MRAAGVLRGAPASMTATRRRARPRKSRTQARAAAAHHHRVVNLRLHGDHLRGEGSRSPPGGDNDRCHFREALLE